MSDAKKKQVIHLMHQKRATQFWRINKFVFSSSEGLKLALFWGWEAIKNARYKEDECWMIKASFWNVWKDWTDERVPREFCKNTINQKTIMTGQPPPRPRTPPEIAGLIKGLYMKTIGFS